MCRYARGNVTNVRRLADVSFIFNFEYFQNERLGINALVIITKWRIHLTLLLQPFS